MVAITVVIAFLVWNFANNNDVDTPKAELSIVEEPENNLTLVHVDGDEIDWDDMEIEINNESIKKPSGTFNKGERYILIQEIEDKKVYYISIEFKPNDEILLCVAFAKDLNS